MMMMVMMMMLVLTMTVPMIVMAVVVVMLLQLLLLGSLCSCRIVTIQTDQITNDRFVRRNFPSHFLIQIGDLFELFSGSVQQIECNRCFGRMIVPRTGRCRVQTAAMMNVLLHQIGKVFFAGQTGEIRIGKAALLFHFLVLLRCVLEKAQDAPFAQHHQIVIVTVAVIVCRCIVAGTAAIVIACLSGGRMIAEQFVNVRTVVGVIREGGTRRGRFVSAAASTAAASETIRFTQRRCVQHFFA